MSKFSLNREEANKDSENNTTISVLAVLSQLLHDAYEGRVKPDNKGDKGTIRESLDNMPFIRMLQTEIGDILGKNIKDYE